MRKDIMRALSAALGCLLLLSSCKASIILQTPAGTEAADRYVHYSADNIGVPYIPQTDPQSTINTAPAPETTAAPETNAPVTSAPLASEQTAPPAQPNEPEQVTDTQTEPETAAPQTAAPKPAAPQTTVLSTTAAQTKTPQTPPDASLSPNSYYALNYDTVKGIWITYFELYPILTGKSAEQFRTGIGEYYDNARSLGLNTVYVHVRPYGDALYKSDYYPWSKYCTGYIGDAPDFDPLSIMIEEAHARGLSFQAWVNPLRCWQEDDAPYVSDTFAAKRWYNDYDGDKIVKVGGYWYLNPAYSDVRELIANGAEELTAKYDVDGVHIDDYFYPTIESWFDSTAYKNSSYDDLAQFRLDNCSKMVSEMYSAVKRGNSSALFGISTQGNISNNMYTLYADVKRWCTQPGYADYMAPQIYYGFNNTAQPFNTVLAEWDDMLKGTGRKLIPGLAVYKIGTEDVWAGDGAYEWMTDTEIIKRQTRQSLSAQCAGGVILYSYQFIFSPESSVAAAVQSEIDAVRPLLT